MMDVRKSRTVSAPIAMASNNLGGDLRAVDLSMAARPVPPRPGRAAARSTPVETHGCRHPAHARARLSSRRCRAIHYRHYRWAASSRTWCAGPPPPSGIISARTHRAYGHRDASSGRARQRLQGAALNTETDGFVSASSRHPAPFNGNKALAELVQKNIEAIGMPKWSDDDRSPSRVPSRSRWTRRWSACLPRCRRCARPQQCPAPPRIPAT